MKKALLFFDVRSLIVVILTRPVRLTYVGSDANTAYKSHLLNIFSLLCIALVADANINDLCL